MFFLGTPNVFVPSDSVFMLFKCMCNNISIEKKEDTEEERVMHSSSDNIKFTPYSDANDVQNDVQVTSLKISR